MDNFIDTSTIIFPSGIQIIPFYTTPSLYEISCVLFERCNLKCKFCFESHENTNIDYDYIKTIPQLVVDQFRIEYEKYPTITRINIMLWGGELFIDNLTSNGICDVYRNLVDEFRNLIGINFPRIKQLTFSWLSNGVFTNRKSVEDLIRYSNGVLNFSYDPIDRYSNDKQKLLMIENSKYFFNLGLSNIISITLTKQTIEKFISNESDIGMLIGIGNTIDVNFYIANPGWETIQPSDDDLFNFFKWAVDNRYFNIKIIERFFYKYVNENIIRHCDCKTCSQITHGVWSIDCAKRSSVLPTEQFFGKYSNEITEENSNDVKSSFGIMKRGCLMCEYFNVCQMPCWISIIHKGYRCTSCPYKRMFEYIDNDIQLVQEFKRWYYDR